MTLRSDRPPVSRLQGFTYRESKRASVRTGGRSVPNADLHATVLNAEEIALPRLAASYGTPLYVYSSATIRDRYHTLDRAFRGLPHTICYSVKANSNLSILRLLARQGCGFDVVSGGELERVLVADRRAAKKVVFSGVGKSRDEMTAALKAGILLFNVESASELMALAECATKLRKIARVAL